jgi:ribonuclease I
MNCPHKFPLCVTLTIESGLGKHHYNGHYSGVRGLWPSVPPYGNSVYIKPLNTTFNIHYNNPGLMCNYVNETRDDFWFAYHEWEKHGLCAMDLF